MSVDWDRTLPPQHSFRSLDKTSITNAGVQALCLAVDDKSAIKRLEYDHSQSSIPPFSASQPPLRLSYNRGITDASCAALADLLRTAPHLESLE